ncbi:MULTISPECIES: ABC transporter ATP-binding protein [unclassified Duganella]|uniref:ABC transporter ATP-binding protein n=1 Tax=unclassified Duganella TaxID=2636909 RepID=UPI00088F0F92|nr:MULTISPECIES: ABC transporter ATP-binding protein [unclassified Duganella]SDG54801.1 ABC-2 type transport system ATP-binding protein [Duganella sp. OV458]SDJ77464.1 ABC-2 type transport system ATP-binding protein [Duganella sp. OV510]
MTVPALRFQQVVKRYGAATVLRGVDLELRVGESFGLVGVNGAGKTSLIKCLLDFCALDGGSIDIFGQPHHRPSARATLGFLPERFTPPYYLTGADFIRYLLSLQGMRYDPQAVSATLAALDLDAHALKQKVRNYSKGMTQKLGLAASLLAQKPLYVLDEPMSGLDPKARACLKEQLRARHRAGSTLFLTSHALADVDELCDRMAILHDGHIRFAGTPAECRAQYGVATLEQAFLACIA